MPGKRHRVHKRIVFWVWWCSILKSRQTVKSEKMFTAILWFTPRKWLVYELQPKTDTRVKKLWMVIETMRFSEYCRKTRSIKQRKKLIIDTFNHIKTYQKKLLLFESQLINNDV